MMTRRTSDNTLLEGLVNKYGKDKLIKTINKMNEEYKSGIDNIWLCVDENGAEKMFSNKNPYGDGPMRGRKTWQHKYATLIYLPTGTIEKLIGYDLTWDDEPFVYSHK